MAVVLIFRAMVALSPSAYRVVKTEQAASGQPGPSSIPRALWQRIAGEESDEDLSVALSAEIATLASVATFSGSFPLRKAQVEFSITDGTTVTDDKRVTTFHFAKLAGGTPSDTWLAADFEAVEAALDAMWASIKPLYQGFTKLAGVRWYKSGPDITPPQEPVRVVDRDVVGTSASGAQLPHQVAVSVTEQTSSRRAWGRFYLPSPNVGLLNGSTGRWTSAGLTTLANAVDTFYEACATANVPVVVYSTAKSSRSTAGGGTLPAIAARALTVDQVQIDDVPDVIRSRRLKTTALKVQRAIGS